MDTAQWKVQQQCASCEHFESMCVVGVVGNIEMAIDNSRGQLANVTGEWMDDDFQCVTVTVVAVGIVALDPVPRHSIK